MLYVLPIRPERFPLFQFPLFDTRIPAGFPSPADDYVQASFDLNERLIKHPAATFFVWTSGRSMEGVGIHDGDILIVDRAIEPRDGHIVVAAIDGELTVKRLKWTDNHLFLLPENPLFPALDIDPFCDFAVWGVVIHVIHSFDL